MRDIAASVNPEGPSVDDVNGVEDGPPNGRGPPAGSAAVTARCGRGSVPALAFLCVRTAVVVELNARHRLKPR